LTACHKTDYERAEAQSAVHVKRKNGHRRADDEKGYEDHPHDRQQCRCEARGRDRLLHGCYRHAGLAPVISAIFSLIPSVIGLWLPAGDGAAA